MNSFRDLTICILTSLLSHWLINSIAMGYSLLAVTSSPQTLQSTPSSLDSANLTLLLASLARFLMAGMITVDILSVDILWIHRHMDFRVCERTSDSESVISLQRLGSNLDSVSSLPNASDILPKLIENDSRTFQDLSVHYCSASTLTNYLLFSSLENRVAIVISVSRMIMRIWSLSSLLSEFITGIKSFRMNSFSITWMQSCRFLVIAFFTSGVSSLHNSTIFVRKCSFSSFDMCGYTIENN